MARPDHSPGLPNGTPEDVLAAARTIQQSGRGVVLSSAFESATGMSVLVSMSAHIGTAAPGFGTYRYLTGDIGPYQDWLCQPAIMYSKLPTEPGSHLDISRMNELIV